MILISSRTVKCRDEYCSGYFSIVFTLRQKRIEWDCNLWIDYKSNDVVSHSFTLLNCTTVALANILSSLWLLFVNRTLHFVTSESKENL